MPYTETIDICICTYRRDSLTEALHSLDGTMADLPVSILVIDNDETPSAKPLVDRYAATKALPVTYIHAPKGNISIARNAALNHSTARYLSFLDDDETASADWVRHLHKALVAKKAAAILGPVRAVYDGKTPDWMPKADLHSTGPVYVDGEIRTGYSCNVMIDRNHAACDGLEFDLALGRSGGEDTAFFAQLHEAGGRIEYAPDALVHEKVLPERARFSWLATRRYRMGQTHGRLLRRQTGAVATIKGVSLALAKSAYCAASAALSAFNPVRRNRAALRGCLHLGTLSAFLGLRKLELYGNKNTGITQ